MAAPDWIKGLVASAMVGLIGVGCSTNDSSTNTRSVNRGGDSPAVMANGRMDGGTDRLRTANGMSTYRLDFPTGDQATSVVRLEASGPEQVRVGQPYAWDLKLTNLTDSPLHDVRVMNMGHVAESGTPATRPANNVAAGNRDAQMASARIGADNLAAGSTGSEAAAIWNVGMLKPKESKSFQLRSTADEVGMVGLCLGVSYTPTLCTAVRVVKPALAVSKEGPSQVLICQEINYTYRVTNSGTGALTGVQIEDTLPEGLVTQDNQQSFRTTIGDLKEGETKSVAGKFKATRVGQFSSRAVARSGDVAAASRQVATAVREPALAIDVTGPEAQYVGQAINYQVTVRNTSDTPAENTVVSFNAVGGNERVQDRNLGTIEAGGSRTFAVNIGAGRQGGQANLTAAVAAQCAKPAQATASVNILTIPALLLECVDSVDPVGVNGDTVYTIVVKNQGSGADSNVTLKAVLPPELQFVRAGGASQVTQSGNTLTFAPVASLAAQATATWTVEVKAVKAGDARFYVEMTSASLTRPAAETEPTRVTTGDAAQDQRQGLPVTPVGGQGPATRPGAEQNK